MEGILVMTGQHIVPGQQIEGAEIVDLFPTILYLLGVPLPSNLDGKVLTEALEQHYVEAHPVRQQEEEPSPSAQIVEEAAYSAEDAEEIRDRLQGLGYID